MKSGSIAVTAVCLAAFACVGVAACGGSAASVSGGDGQSTAGPDAGQGANDDASSTRGGDGGADANDKTTTKVPAVHRPAPVACSHDRGPGDAESMPNAVGDCTKDADCKAGTNGRCNYQKVAARITHCSYDTCFADSDCGAKVCSCREAASDTNACVGGDCQVDADCGAGGYCSPSVDFDKINFGVTSYYCHTAKDACIDDADCNKGGGAQAKCAYDAKTMHWACSSTGFYPP